MLLALLLLLTAGGAFAQSVPTIQNVYARKTFSLNGSWETIVDPFEVGYLDFHSKPYANGGFAANKKPSSPGDHIEYDFDTSPRLQVPGDWNTQRPDLMFYEGTIWYKRNFDYTLPPGHRLFVYFAAANYDAVVFLNGKKLGEHVGGFSPFDFEITKLVRPHGNFLVVNVNDQRHAAGVPALNTDFWNYGGLTRDVMLVDVPETFVQDYFIQLQKGSRNHITGWLKLNGPRRSQTVTVKIPEAGAETSVHTDETGYARIGLDAKLTLWSPENPKLYNVRVEGQTDVVKDTIGFRTIETSGTDLLLNGKPIFLRGIDVHAEAPFRTGRVFSEDSDRTLLGWAKELNCNFVRLAHYPHDEHMTRLADRMGILVWSEIPAYWALQWNNPETYANAQNQLDEMIARDKNRASIILWSIANETPVNDARLAFLSRLSERAHQDDSTRLVTAALLHHYSEPLTVLINDPLGKYLDVIGCNEYIGWYDGPAEKADRVQWKTIYNKPVIMSEFGAGALAGYHGSRDTVWTEEFQRNVYEHQIPMLRRIPFLRGTSAWLLMDFRSPRRLLPNIQDYFNRKGLISERGQKKEAFYVMQQFYESLKKEKAVR